MAGYRFLAFAYSETLPLFYPTAHFPPSKIEASVTRLGRNGGGALERFRLCPRTPVAGAVLLRCLGHIAVWGIAMHAWWWTSSRKRGPVMILWFLLPWPGCSGIGSAGDHHEYLVGVAVSRQSYGSASVHSALGSSSWPTQEIPPLDFFVLQVVCITKYFIFLPARHALGL